MSDSQQESWARWAVAFHQACLELVRRALTEDPKIAAIVDVPERAKWAVSVDLDGRRADVVLLDGEEVIVVGSIDLDPRGPALGCYTSHGQTIADPFAGGDAPN